MIVETVSVGIFMLLLHLQILRVLFDLKFPCGMTVREVKKFFRENSHCGKYWNCKPRFNPFTCAISISMEGNEAYVFSMKTGTGTYLYEDTDGAASRSYEQERTSENI